MIIAFAAVSFALILALPLLLRAAFDRGVKQGRALEWQDRYFADLKKDMERRGADGKFVTRKAGR